MFRWMAFLCLGAMVNQTTSTAQADDPLVLITSFAGNEKGAINAYRLNLQTAALSTVYQNTGLENPYFSVVSRDQKFLYSIYAKNFGGAEPEQVAAYALEGRTGKLKPLNRQSTKGTASCYLDIDATGKTVLVANYSTGNVASLPVKPDGSLGEPVSFFQHAGSSVNPDRQKSPNAHCFVISPDNRFAFAADLGIDQVLSYRLDAATAKLTQNQPPFAKVPAGAGPRHLTFHPNGKHVYVINELKNSVTHYEYATETGVMSEQKTVSTLPADFTGVSNCADVKVTPNGKYLYGTNRGHDSIAAFRVAEDGSLTHIGNEPSLGKTPQNLAIVANGSLLLCANMGGNNVVAFRIDETTGRLKPVGKPVEIASPSCIRILP